MASHEVGTLGTFPQKKKVRPVVPCRWSGKQQAAPRVRSMTLDLAGGGGLVRGVLRPLYYLNDAFYLLRSSDLCEGTCCRRECSQFPPSLPPSVGTSVQITEVHFLRALGQTGDNATVSC